MPKGFNTYNHPLFQEVGFAHEVSGGAVLALLSQEGSVIETAVEITRGEVQVRIFLRFPWEPPPAASRKKHRDAAALLAQEGKNRSSKRLYVQSPGGD